MNLLNLTDEALMELYQSGDDKAFEVLFNRHSGRVFAFLQSKTSPQNARDLVQETFLKLHKARHQYSSQYPFLPWLFTITRNTLYDFLKLNETKLSQYSVNQEVEAPELLEPKPEFALALQSLPEAQRRAIELRYLSDWSFEKIAADMKTSPLNVRQLVSRGIRKLRSKAQGGKRS